MALLVITAFSNLNSAGILCRILISNFYIIGIIIFWMIKISIPMIFNLSVTSVSGLFDNLLRAELAANLF